MNVIKVLWCRILQYLGMFTIFLLEPSSEMGLSRHLSDYVFGVRNFQNTKSMRVIFFFRKYSKFNVDFENAGKNREKNFCLWDNCIWIGVVKLSLLRTWYFSSVANVLTTSPKILHVNKRDFFQLNWLGSGQWISAKVCDADFNSAWARLRCCLSKGPLKRDFLDIYLTTLSKSVISEIQKFGGSIFFSKYSKFNLNFKNAAKTWETFFCFWDNCIWLGVVKFSLLRTGHFHRYPMF